ncbi:MAG: hypothetical protein IT162_11745 [Bryobacterales bacterium]|nr:hypothetical protein [Bryobacterales bacterium]
MTVSVTIRVQSPLLKRLLKPKPRIEKLPPFRQQRGEAQPSPLSMWLGTIGVATGGLALAMFASSDATLARPTGIEAVDDLLSPQRAVAAEDLPRPPRSYYPYGAPSEQASR